MFHRVLKASLMARKVFWYCALPIVLMGILITPNESSYAPFAAVTGTFIYCPHPVLDKHRSGSNNETVKLFVSEKRKIDF